jgi:hypothetical protein
VLLAGFSCAATAASAAAMYVNDTHDPQLPWSLTGEIRL